MSEFQKITDISPINFHKEDALDGALSEVFANADLMSELVSLGIKKEEIRYYLPLLLTVLDERKACASCPGLAECPFPEKGMVRTLQLDPGGRLSSSLGYCKKAQEKADRDKHFLCRDFPKEWRDLPYNTILRQVRFKPLSEAYLLAKKKGSPTPWVYIYSESGVGKSYGLAALANFIAQKGMEVAYLDTAKRFDILKGLAIEEKERFQSEMNLLSKVDCLFLDGFGDEFKSEYVRDQILLPLLIARSRDRLLTFFASCYPLETIASLYSLSKLGQPMGARLSSLIESNIKAPIYLKKSLESFL